MPIQKLTLQVTVLCDTDTLSEAVNAYSEMSLSQIHEAINFGDDIGGSIEVIHSNTLANPSAVRRELLAVGNDGSFFDCNLSDDDSSDDPEIAGSHKAGKEGGSAATYEVIATRDTTESCCMLVEAEDEADALEKALARASSDKDLVWEHDDNIPQPPYVNDAVEVDPSQNLE